MKHEHWEARKQCIEHFGKNPTIQNSAHRKPSKVFFNSSSGTIITEALNVEHISIFGICEEVRHFAQHYCDVTFANHNGQLTLDDSHASDSGAVRREERTILGAKSKLLYSEIALTRKAFGIGHMYIYTFCLQWPILWPPRGSTLPPGTRCISTYARQLYNIMYYP